jgi:hypothetical protein
MMAAIQQVYDEISGESKISGISLKEIKRTPYPDEPVTDENLQILNKQIDMGRDALTLTSAEMGDMCTDFVDKTIQQLQEIFNREERQQRSTKAPKMLRTRRAANAVLSKSFQAMMRRWMQICSDKITSQTSTDGSGFAPLSAGYRRKKVKHVSFGEPILVRTGQLRDNLNPSELAKNMIIHAKGTFDTSTGLLKADD